VDPLWHLGLAVGLTLLVSLPLATSVWALLDAARRPQWAWALAGRSQVAWMGGILFGTLTLVIGLGVSIWYLTKVRPLVAAAEEGRLEL
jgi:hypothetical protein